MMIRATAKGLVGMLGQRRKQRRREHIERDLARILASHVAVGLMRNAEPAEPMDADGWRRELEQSAHRARTALLTIGLMLANATDDPQVVENLNAADTFRRAGRV